MRILGVFALVLLLLVSSGCTLRQHLVHHAVDYNKTVEEVQNRMLLLNIIRASQRRPMYFTGIGSITASPSYTVSGGGGTFEDTGATEGTKWTLPSGSYSNKPTMQVGVLDTQEFVSGILSPVAIETLAYYLEQGWRADLLAHLLVERVEFVEVIDTEGSSDTEEGEPKIHKPSEPVEPTLLALLQVDERCDQALIDISTEEDPSKTWALLNDPSDERSRLCFQALVELIGDQRICRLKETLGRGTEVSRALALKHEPPLSSVLTALETGVLVHREETASDNDSSTDTHFTLHHQTTTWILSCSRPRRTDTEDDSIESSSLSGGTKDDPPAGTTDPLSLLEQRAFDAYIANTSLLDSRHCDTQPMEDKPQAALILRSPQGVLYYLGELLRLLDNDLRNQSKLPQVGMGDDRVPLFWAWRGNWRSCRPQVDVEYRGDWHIIPAGPEKGVRQDDGCVASGSMRTLTLVSQLFALHKKAENLPGTPVVRVVGD